MIITYFFGEAIGASIVARGRENPDTDQMPPDGIPILPDEERVPPIDTPPDQPNPPDNQPDPPPIREPDPTEPTRLF